MVLRSALFYPRVFMQKTTYTALKPFDLSGRSVEVGEDVTLSPMEAAVHSRHGHVSLSSPRLQTRDLVPEPAAEDPPKRRRGRPRKTDSDRPKRQYRRRDLTAED